MKQTQPIISRFPLGVVLSLLCCLIPYLPAAAQWVPQAAAFKKRSEVSSVVYNNKLYAFLGFSNAALEAEPSSEVYDPTTNAWTLLAAIPAGKAVTHQGVALVDNTVWHLGGRVGQNPAPLTSEVWIYNVATNSWSAGPPLTDPATGARLPWGGGGAALLGRTLHVFGGFVNTACENDQDRYHLTLAVDQWLANPAATKWQNTLAPLPVKRNHLSTVVLGGKIYALGGQFDHDCNGAVDQAFCHVYDPVANAWTRLPNLPTPRSHAEGGAFAADGKIYLVAGQGTDGAATDVVTVFDPAANNGLGSWTNRPDLTLPARYEGVSAKLIGSTFIISHGGINSSRGTQQTTYSRPLARTPVYRLGFSATTLNLRATAGSKQSAENLLFTIDGTKGYKVTTTASWLRIDRNATGTALPTAVPLAVTADAAALAPGTYQTTVEATGTGSGPAYTAARFVVNLTVEAGQPTIDVPAERVFSGVKATTSAAQAVVVRNSGTAPLRVDSIRLTGTHAEAFRLVSPPALPLTVAPGQSATLSVAFAPGSAVGSLSAALRLVSNAAGQPAVSVGLYGLSTKGLQGSNEPALQSIVNTLGYTLNVGRATLLLPTTPDPIGDELVVPQFQKAGSGPVTITPVARYSPNDLVAFGYYTTSGGAPTYSPVATLALNQEQTLNPQIVAGGGNSFDPGTTSFGFYAGPAPAYANWFIHTDDALNAPPVPLRHAVRVYPLKNRAGQLVPNSYLIGMEPASNGDYQDYVFVVGNVKPATTAPQPSTVRINAGGTATTVGDVAWSGCDAAGSCGGYVTGGFAYTEKSRPTISGATAPVNQAILQTEWTGGETNNVPVGGVAFSYSIPVANGRYTVRLHFVELNKNGPGLRLFDVNVEGGAKELTNFDIFAEAGGLYKAIVRDFPVTVTDGTITIDFIRQVQNAKIGAIEILPAAAAPVTYEAEDAVLNQAVVVADHPGFSGTGFVDYLNPSGDYIEWTVNPAAAGPATLQFRYANGGAANRPLRLEVNGKVLNATLAFASTTDWAEWATVSAEATLQAGPNTVRLTAVGSSGPNVDYLRVEPGAATQARLLATSPTLAPAGRWTVFPNPATGYARLTVDNSAAGSVRVRVLNLLGAEQRQVEFSKPAGSFTYELPLTRLAAGVYLVSLEQGASRTMLRVIVE